MPSTSRSPDPSKVAVFTIVSNNYSAHARVLMNSLLAYEPGWDRWVLVVDTPLERSLIKAPLARVKYAPELPLPSPNSFFIRYDILEANTAVKPWMIEWLFDQGYESVVYLDPDIRLFSPLIELSAALANYSVILTPHITQPYNDNKHPDELAIKRTGIFNLGFTALRNDEEGRRVVRWWQGHLAENCVNALERGIFVDQSWMSFCPAYCDRLHVLKHPGYNAAYWNLHYRPITGYLADKDPKIAGREPLRFYHFSGFDYRHPSRLSKHQDRFSDSSLSADMCALLRDYAESLLSEEISTIAEIPYGLGLPGLPSRQASSALENDCFNPVFHSENPAPTLAEWYDFLQMPDPREPQLPIFLANLWHRRPDLRNAFPLDQDGSIESFCHWFDEVGRTAEKFSPTFPAWGWWCRGETANPVIIDEKPLVTVYGYFEAESGVGESARGSVRALEQLKYPHRVVNFSVGNQSRKRRPDLRFSLAGASGAIDLIHVNCDQAEVFLNHRPEVRLPGRYRIAYWAWEQEHLPPLFFEHAALVDEIWCPSSANTDLFRRATRQPVRTAWHNLDLHKMAARSSLDTLVSLPAGIRYFLAFADFHSIPERKGPLQVVEAYTLAFPQPVPGIALVVKIANASYRPDYWAKLLTASVGRPDIIYVTASLPRAELNRLLADAHGFISLHAHEGFGLPIAEAIALGVPVVCTNYGGNMDFCSDENSRLVPHVLVELAENHGPYLAGTHWAKPDVAAAAAHLLELARVPPQPSRKAPRSPDSISRRSFEMYAANLAAASAVLLGRHPQQSRVNASAALPVTPMILGYSMDQFLVENGRLVLAGWADLEVPSMSMVNASVIIRGPAQNLTLPLQRIKRLDVAQHHSDAQLLYSGFYGIFPLGHLPSANYEIDILFETPTGQTVWATGREFRI